MADQVSPNLRLYKIEQLTRIADALRYKLGTSDTFTVDEMGETIENMDIATDIMALVASGDAFDFDDATIKTKSSAIPAHMFRGCQGIRKIDKHDILEIGSYAFTGSKVNRINLPDCFTIGSYAFDTCTSLRNTTLNIPKCTSIGDYAFNNCRCDSSSYTFDFSKVESIGANAFYEAGFFKSVSDVNLPECTSISNAAFGTYYDTYRVAVTNFNLPKIVTLGNQVFRGSRITNLILGENITTMGTYVFQNASITNLYVYATTPPTVGSFEGTLTHIYVPAESVDTYKAASKWSAFASRIEAIPEA